MPIIKKSTNEQPKPQKINTQTNKQISQQHLNKWKDEQPIKQAATRLVVPHWELRPVEGMIPEEEEEEHRQNCTFWVASSSAGMQLKTYKQAKLSNRFPSSSSEYIQHFG